MATQPVRGLKAAAVIDRYQLVERIGKGGMAEVFHARLQRIGGFERDVAVKVLLPEYSSEPEFVEMLLDEARIAGSITHPCVVQVLDVGREGEQFYLVMEHVDGSDLRSLLRAVKGGRLPLGMALHITGEVLRGLAAVHGAVDREGASRRIIHRDVSPANVLIDRSGVVKLGDFGIARAQGRISRTRHGAIKGKLRYMAPEQLAGQAVDHRADLYAVGIVLAELLLGDLEAEPKRMTSFGPVFRWSRGMAEGRMPRDIADLVDRAVAENPAKRYLDAESFRRDVAAALHRRAPGYAMEDLACELRALGAWTARANGEPTEVGKTPAGPVVRDSPQAATGRPLLQVVPPPSEVTSPDASGGLFAGEQRATTPFTRDAAEADPWACSPPVGDARAVDGSLASCGWLAPRGLRALRLRGLLSKRVLLVGAGAAATVIALALAIVIGGPSAVAPIPPPAPRPVVSTSLAAPRAATGTLTVEGPAGVGVTIGTTSYPSAPCRIELPPGDYTVKLKKRARSRPIIRRVTIAPGQAVTLRL